MIAVTAWSSELLSINKETVESRIIITEPSKALVKGADEPGG